MRPRARSCPTCDAPLPFSRRPQNLRQALLGGWTCQTCGTELDRAGRALVVPPDRSGPPED